MPGLSHRSLFLVPLLVCACHRSITVPLAPKEYRALPANSWVVLIGGERVQVEGGQATPDSIVGEGRSGGRFAVPRDSVAFVEERKLSVGRTLGTGAAALGVGVAAATVAVAVTFMWIVRSF